MKCPQNVMFFVLAGLISAGFPGVALAELSLKPNFSVREEYNDNIFLTDKNTSSDFITTVSPGLGISYKLSMLELSADYGLNFKFYAKNSDQNETSFNQAQNAKVNTTLTLLRDRLFIKLDDVYQRVPIDQRNQMALGNVFVNMTNTNRLNVNPNFVYPITSTINLNGGYTYSNIWYDAPEADNSQDHTFSGGLSKTFGDRLALYVNYSYFMHRPRQTPEYDQQTGTVGGTLQVTPKFTVSGSVGETKVAYGSHAETTAVIPVTLTDQFGHSITGPRRVQVKPNDTSSPVWNLQGTYRLTERFSLSAGYTESFSESGYQLTPESKAQLEKWRAIFSQYYVATGYSDSIYGGATKTKAYTGSIDYKGTIPVSLSAFRTVSTFNLINREDRSFGGVLGVSVPLSADLTARVSGNYTHYNFKPDGEVADRYGANFNIDYPFKRLKASFGYTFSQNLSNVAGRDYTNNIVFIMLAYNF